MRKWVEKYKIKDGSQTSRESTSPMIFGATATPDQTSGQSHRKANCEAQGEAATANVYSVQ